MDEHVILVAIEIEAPTRVDAMLAVQAALPRPGHLIVGFNETIESWWLAEDDRNDRSDRDSAVFVSKGKQHEAFDLLLTHMLTSTWNQPPDAPATATCRHCGRRIVNDPTEGWIDLEAGYDDEDGDGVWRETCDENDTFEARHEPDDERKDQ